MNDIVDPETRSRMMSGIRGKNTKPEMAIRSGLHALGYRFRLHRKGLPGRPDIVLPKHKAVIFVNGCFWHGHQCKHFKWPKTRSDFWRKKIAENCSRDIRNYKDLLSSGWRVGVVWECATKGRSVPDLNLLLSDLSDWIRSQEIQKDWTERSDESRSDC